MTDGPIMDAADFFEFEIPKGPPPGPADDVLGRIGAAAHALAIELYSLGNREQDRIADAFERFAQLIEQP